MESTNPRLLDSLLILLVGFAIPFAFIYVRHRLQLRQWRKDSAAREAFRMKLLRDRYLEVEDGSNVHVRLERVSERNK